MKRFWIALGFLTVLPTPRQEQAEIDELGRAAAWFPLVGFLIGALVVLLQMEFAMILPSPVSAVLSVAAWVFLTGGLHLDGLADSLDGLVNASSPERRLEIMKDPRLGTFGALGLILVLLLKVSVLALLPHDLIWVAVPLAASTARWMLLWSLRQPMARPGGLGAAFQKGINTSGIVIASIIPLALVVLSGWRGVAALILSALLALGIFRWARSGLGGMTGDVLGMLVETVEAAVLLVFVAY